MFSRPVRKLARKAARLRAELLEGRDVPAVWMNYTGDHDATNPDNWAYDWGESPGSVSSLHFTGDCTDDCVGLAGYVNSIDIGLYYTGHVVLGGPLTAMWLSQMNGVIDQPLGDGSPITVTMWWNWVGGTLNGSGTPSTLTLGTGGWAGASIDPSATTGAVATGDTLVFNSATVSINPGTIDFLGGLGMVVQNASAVTVTPMYGATTSFTTPNGADPNDGKQIRLTGGSTYTVSGANDFTRIAVASTNLPISNDGGTLSVEQGANLTVRGRAQDANQPDIYFGSLYQRAGTTRLQNGGSLTADSGVQINGGSLYTIANPVLQQAGEQFFVITGNLRVDAPAAGAEPNVAIDFGTSPHVRGELRVVGDARWTGGTYKPVIDIASAANADLWRVSGTFTVGAGTKVAPELMNLPPDKSIPLAYRARVIYAGGGFLAPPNTQEVPKPDRVLPPGVVLNWYGMPGDANDPAAARYWALGPDQ